MTKKIGIWQKIGKKTQQSADSNSRQNLDDEKFAIYSIITHSTAIEGSTLTEPETKILFEKGLTAKNKPLVHHLMNADLRNAYMFAVEQAVERTAWTPDYLKRLNALVMKNTGGVTSVMGGDFDSSKGDFRLCGVSAGYGGKSYESHLKIPAKTDEFCRALNKELDAIPTPALTEKSENLQKLYEITFRAHLDLVTIHPWIEGNGRTARLLMNFLQFYFKLAPTKTFLEDREEYIASLRESQDKKDSARFLEFMAGQHLKTLEGKAAK
jgi:Fic family protein